MIVDNWPDHVRILSNVDFANKKYDVSPAMDGSNAASAWEWTKEGDENILRGVFDENGESIVYKYDQNRGLTRESVVMDYGVAQLNELGEYDKDAEYMVDTAKLSIDDHINTMTVIAKYIDSAMSKTINIPNDYSFDDFKRVYDKIYDSGVIKGCTTYRDGTMTAVLSETGTQPAASSTAAIQKILRTKAPKRPKALECDIHHLTINGDKWLVFIGLYGDARDPYEVFAFKRNGIQISPKVTFGKLIKVKQRNHQTRYDLDLGDIIIEDICSHFKTGEESALTRMISTALRHGADMDYIYDQLMKAEGTVVSFSKAVARSIKTYVKTVHDSNCPECGGEGTVVMTEGCMKCTACGASKC
jgi:ribonucleoside-diphosphate reductase alpha chain